MSTISAQEVTDPATKYFERWCRLHDERRFRVEQLAGLDLETSSSHGDSSVDKALRIAVTTILRDVDAALQRMKEDRYGLCAACSQPIPDDRLDVLPMARLCMSCHYNEQNCRLGRD